MLDVVRVRLPEAGSEAEFKEPPLQSGAREAGGLVERDCPPQSAMTVVSNGPSEELFNRPQVEEASIFRALD